MQEIRSLVTPALSIIDPDMVASLPASIAAYTGMDALGTGSTKFNARIVDEKSLRAILERAI